MNIWLKSILTGCLIALIIFFLSDKLNTKKKITTYRIDYAIKVEPDTNSTVPNSFSKIAAVLSKRLEAAAYKHEITSSGENIILVSLFEMKDTLYPASILTYQNRVRFRELYNINELSETLTAVHEVMLATALSGEEKKELPQERDSISTTARQLLDSMEMYNNIQGVDFLIDFVVPYQDQSGTVVYPAQIGKVKMKDTGAVRKLFQADKVKRITPADMQLCYGETDKKTGGKKEDQLLPLYLLKIKEGPGKISLGNDDILDASQDFDEYGKPEIRLQFNAQGSNKWAVMTRQNTGRSIAIVINDEVVSAPTVISPIEDGSSLISGNYTVNECILLAIGIRSRKLPVNLAINSIKITPEKRPGETNRKLLLTFLVFLVSAGLAGFIFKTLKST